MRTSPRVEQGEHGAVEKVPVMAAYKAAWDFQRRHTRDAAGALSLAAIGSILAAYGQGVHAAPVQLFGVLAQVIGGTMGYGALFRMAFADEHPSEAAFRPGPYGFQWSGPEWRLIGAGLLSALVGVACFIAPVVIGVAIDRSLGPGLFGPAEAVGAVVGACAAIYALVRLSPALAATVALQRVVVLGVWTQTGGQFWRILAVLLLFALTMTGFILIGGIVLGAIIVAVNMASHASAPAGLGAVLGGALGGLLTSYVQLPLISGLLAYLYRGLRTPLDAPESARVRSAKA